MDIKFQYFQSLEKGFGIKIHDSTEKETDFENWKPASFPFSNIKIKKAEYLLIKDFCENPSDQAKLNASCNKSLSSSLCEELPNLLHEVSINLTASNFMTLDGTRIFITILDMNNEVPLKYNGTPPNQWKGIHELQEFFENLYNSES